MFEPESESSHKFKSHFVSKAREKVEKSVKSADRSLAEFSWRKNRVVALSRRGAAFATDISSVRRRWTQLEFDGLFIGRAQGGSLENSVLVSLIFVYTTYAQD